MATRMPPPSKPPTNPPNQSLYLQNLPEKIRKPDLRLSLYTLFATYGPVLDVVAMRGKSLRGQAWVVYRDVRDSTLAMRALQGFDFFGQELKIQYAKGKSDTIAKLDGTYRMPTAIVNQNVGTELQQQIFGAPPSGLPAVPPAPVNKSAQENGGMDVDRKDEDSKGVKRGREEEEEGSDEEVAMEEDDSDAPMEDSSDDDDD